MFTVTAKSRVSPHAVLPAASKKDPGSRSAPPARGWPAIGRYQPGDQRRTSSGGDALPADSRGPAHGVPAAGTVPARAPQVTPGATGHDPDRHQPADSLPAARVTGRKLGSPGAPAGTCCPRRSDRMPGSGRLQSRHRESALSARLGGSVTVLPDLHLSLRVMLSVNVASGLVRKVHYERSLGALAVVAGRGARRSWYTVGPAGLTGRT